jgi:hypothetical protein
VGGRVSIHQWLELYNIFGVSNAKRMERFTDFLKRQVQNMEAADRFVNGLKKEPTRPHSPIHSRAMDSRDWQSDGEATIDEEEEFQSVVEESILRSR